ncbi:MAG: hypothetical protein LBC61_05470 [Candidatus Peribacteria bacterium]|nr:hypothetical protein [Candidatus Peribacteria bacterium]
MLILSSKKFTSSAGNSSAELRSNSIEDSDINHHELCKSGNSTKSL